MTKLNKVTTSILILIAGITSSCSLIEPIRKIVDDAKLVKEADNEAEQGNLDKAIELYTEALKDNASNPEIYHKRSNAYLKKKEYELALSDINKAIEIKPKVANFYITRSAIYTNSGKYDKAIIESSIAIGLNPKLPMAYNNRGYSIPKKKDLMKLK